MSSNATENFLDDAEDAIQHSFNLMFGYAATAPNLKRQTQFPPLLTKTATAKENEFGAKYGSFQQIGSFFSNKWTPEF